MKASERAYQYTKLNKTLRTTTPAYHYDHTILLPLLAHALQQVQTTTIAILIANYKRKTKKALSSFFILHSTFFFLLSSPPDVCKAAVLEFSPF